MKQVHFIGFLVFLSLAVGLFSCSDKDKNEPETGITGYSWTEGKAVEITLGEPLLVTFKASDNWTASTTSTWCTLMNQSGEAGQNTLRLQVVTATNVSRTATIILKVNGASSTSFQVTQNVTDSSSNGNVEINAKVDQYLRNMYLWNDEYKTLTLDYTKEYDAFFNDALLSMKTNTLDKRLNIYNEYSIFSYIEKKNTISSTRITALVNKELEYNFGIVGITPVGYTDGSIVFCIQGVYPDSPAKQAGIKRGTIITEINGDKLSENNYVNCYYDLLYPTFASTLELTDLDNNKLSLTSKAMYTNPVLLNEVKEIGGHKIGYLVYSRFDAGFDEELFNAFKELKSKNITDLILDLRYNGGGHTISANLIATCIAGAASKGKVFASYRYNDERMKKQNNKRTEELFDYSRYANLNTSLAAGALELTHIYCLVTNSTASASELVINALRGIDVSVTLIGEKTVGKNVGMEYIEETVGGNTYRIVPISFQSYNAKGFGEYEAGFTPDRELDETNPYNEPNVFYGYRDYGTSGEYLYATTVEMITGQEYASDTRSIENHLKGKVQKTPRIYRLGRDGMLMKYNKE